MATKPEENSLSFEEGMNKLETIVEKMESGELGLEQSMKAYEAGMQHIKQCRAQLNAVEKKIEVLSESEE